MGDGVPSAPSEPSPPRPILFDLPLEITQARIQDLGVRVRDLQAVPPVDLTSRTSLTLTDLSAEGRPAELDLRVVSAECLDLFRVRGTGALRSEGADLSLELTLAGLRPAAARGLFVAAGLDPRAERLLAEARLQLTASPLEGNPEQVAARLTLDRTGVRADGVEALGLEQFEVQVDALGAGVLGSAPSSRASSRRLRSGGRDADVRGARTGPGRAPLRPALPLSLRRRHRSLSHRALDGPGVPSLRWSAFNSRRAASPSRTEIWARGTGSPPSSTPSRQGPCPRPAELPPPRSRCRDDPRRGRGDRDRRHHRLGRTSLRGGGGSS